MSLKVIVNLIIVFLFISCSKSKQYSNKFSELKETEKDSVSEHYNQWSDSFLQTSELYRVYKDSALTVSPAKVGIRQKLSYSYKKRGEHVKAMEVLNKAVEIDLEKGSVDALQYRIWSLLYYYRDYEGVLSDIKLMRDVAGESYSACWGEPCGFHEGQALYKLDKYEEAIAAFERVNREEKELGFDIEGNYFNYFYMGRCYAKKEMHQKAITYYDKALVGFKDSPEAYFYKAMSFKRLGDNVRAKEFFENARVYIANSMEEPYVERFDEVFLYMIDDELEKIGK